MTYYFCYSSDTGPHVNADEMNMSVMYELIRNITSLVHKTYPNTTIIPSLGNHDIYPDNQTPMSPNSYYGTLLQECGWNVFLSNTAEQDTFLAGKFYFNCDHFKKQIEFHLILLLRELNKLHFSIILM